LPIFSFDLKREPTFSIRNRWVLNQYSKCAATALVTPSRRHKRVRALSGHFSGEFWLVG